MLRILLILTVLFGQAAKPALAKPLLTNSQDTFATVCGAGSESYDRLIEICSKALEASDLTKAQTLSFLESLGWAYLETQQNELAKAKFEKMLGLDPKSLDALDGLAWFYHDIEDFQTAAAYFKKAMNIRPNARIVAGLGASRYKAGDIEFNEAISFLETARAIDPAYIWAAREQAWMYEGKGWYQQALALFKDILTQAPDDAYALYGAAYVLTEQGNWDEALGYANRALEVDPNYMSALSRRSLILLNLDRPKMALKDGLRIIDVLPDRSDGYVRAGRAYFDMGNRATAISLMTEAAEKVGYDSYLQYWRSKFLFLDERYAQAKDQIDVVIENGDGDFFDHKLRARISLRMQDWEQARKSVDQALAFRPDSRWARFYSARIMVGENRFDEAEQEFDLAVANGLSERHLKTFLSDLAQRGRYLQVIQMRLRYQDKAAN